jgi:hypothetical protein
VLLEIAFPDSATIAVDLTDHVAVTALVDFVVLATVVVPPENVGRNPNSKSVLRGSQVVTLYYISFC